MNLLYFTLLYFKMHMLRVFSQAALTKTKVRNKMGHKLLISILMIRSNITYIE